MACMLVQKWGLGIESSRSCGGRPAKSHTAPFSPARAHQRRTDPRRLFKATAGNDWYSQALHSTSGAVSLVAVARIILKQLAEVELCVGRELAANNEGLVSSVLRLNQVLVRKWNDKHIKRVTVEQLVSVERSL
jgi:hypothetical protein